MPVTVSLLFSSRSLRRCGLCYQPRWGGTVVSCGGFVCSGGCCWLGARSCGFVDSRGVAAGEFWSGGNGIPAGGIDCDGFAWVGDCSRGVVWPGGVGELCSGVGGCGVVWFCDDVVDGPV